MQNMFGPIPCSKSHCMLLHVFVCHVQAEYRRLHGMYEELKRQKIKELEGLVEEQEAYVTRMGKVCMCICYMCVRFSLCFAVQHLSQMCPAVVPVAAAYSCALTCGVGVAVWAVVVRKGSAHPGSLCHGLNNMHACCTVCVLFMCAGGPAAGRPLALGGRAAAPLCSVSACPGDSPQHQAAAGQQAGCRRGTTAEGEGSAAGGSCFGLCLQPSVCVLRVYCCLHHMQSVYNSMDSECLVQSWQCVHACLLVTKSRPCRTAAWVITHMKQHVHQADS